MNIASTPSRPARPVAPSFYFTDSSRAQTKSAGLSSTYAKVRKPRYAMALYAAAMAALLSGCAQSDVERVPEAQPIRVTEAPSDMPEVVITATRERPKANG